MDPFEIIQVIMMRAGLDPDVETWGFACVSGKWRAFVEDVHSADGETRESAADEFAAVGIKSCTPWRDWTDDDQVLEGFTRKYKGLRLRIIRGEPAGDEADDPSEWGVGVWDWEIRVYAYNGDEPSMIVKFHHPSMDVDQAKATALHLCNRVVEQIKLRNRVPSTAHPGKTDA